MNGLISSEKIEKRIFLLRGQKVMLDADLAELYGVETGALKRAVQRNRERFPEDFIFPLTFQEVGNLRCQNGISSWGGQRFLPYAFTEQGVAMLSSVLKSKRAVHSNYPVGAAPVAALQMTCSRHPFKRFVLTILLLET